MITGIRGELKRVLEDEVRIETGGIEYQVLVPDVVRRALQLKLGEQVYLRTIEYIEGNPGRGRLTPRLIGFLEEPEIEFFELFCTVDGIGVRTALKAMVKPVRDVADMIQRQDAKLLGTLPGVGGSTSERVIAKLRKKVTKFALMPAREPGGAVPDVEPSVIDDAFAALLSVGHPENDARRKIESALGAGKRFSKAEDLLQAIYVQERTD